MDLATEISRALMPISLNYMQQAESVIRTQIASKRMSQVSLADQLGVSRATIIRHLKDIGTMPVTRFFSLLHILQINPYTLKPESCKAD